jgi:hypothetical protein
MAKIRKTAKELEALVKQSAAKVGRWPQNMSLHVYPLNETWRAMVGYSDADQDDYRNNVLVLIIGLSEKYDLDGA